MYPDFRTALVGTFQSGVMVFAQAAQLIGATSEAGCIMLPLFRQRPLTSSGRKVRTFVAK